VPLLVGGVSSDGCWDVVPRALIHEEAASAATRPSSSVSETLRLVVVGRLVPTGPVSLSCHGVIPAGWEEFKPSPAQPFERARPALSPRTTNLVAILREASSIISSPNITAPVRSSSVAFRYASKMLQALSNCSWVGE